MKISLDIPWHRYALIVELTRRCKGRCPQFGKTALQKMMYLLQEVFHIDCGYDFEFCTCGPFSRQLFQDLDLVEHAGAITIQPAVSITDRYNIVPGGQADILINKGADFLIRDEVKEAIKTLVEEFGYLYVKDLELRSTIIFVQREFQEQGKLLTVNEIVNIVGQIKPKFNDTQIYSAVENLRSRNYLKLK